MGTIILALFVAFHLSFWLMEGYDRWNLFQLLHAIAPACPQWRIALLVLNLEEIGRVKLARTAASINTTAAPILQINLNRRLGAFISFQLDSPQITELFAMITYCPDL